MTDDEPQGEHMQYDGGSDADGAQTYGGASAYGTPPNDSGPSEPTPGYPTPGYPTPDYGSAGYGTPGFSPMGSRDIVAGGGETPKRHIAPVIASVVAVLAIVLAGGGFTAYKMLASKGTQPDAWAPANSIAFAKVDLDPSASAKVAAWEFEQKFPSAPKIASADQLKDSLLDAAFKNDTGTNPLNYATDIKPWLGDRVAVAAFVDSAGNPEAIGILQVKDTAKAEAALNKLKASAGNEAYSIQGGYAVVGNSQGVVDEAVASARKSNIGSNSTYNSDIAHLKTDRLVTVWWDAGATLKSLSGKIPGNAGALLNSGSLTGLPDLSKAGRFVMGVRVQPSYVEVEGRVLGSATSSAVQLTNGDAGATLAQLAGGTVAGVALSNPEQLIKTELQTLKSGVLGAGLQNQLDAAGAQLGISLPGDLENLLGSGLAFGLDSAPTGGASSAGSVLFTALTKPDDPAKALQTAKALAAAASASGSMSLTASANGSSILITNDNKPASGKLGDDPTFKAALAGMPQQAAVAGFVNLSALIAAQPNAPADAKPLDGLGFYVGTDSTSPVFSVKLTVK